MCRRRAFVIYKIEKRHPQIEHPIVLSSRNGFTTYTVTGEYTQKDDVNLARPPSHVNQENVRCMMGYIVDLTVILDDIFRISAGNVSTGDVQTAMDRHIRFGCRNRIHRDIGNFVETFAIMSQPTRRDLIVEKIIDLIRQYCVSPSIGGYS